MRSGSATWTPEPGIAVLFFGLAAMAEVGREKATEHIEAENQRLQGEMSAMQHRILAYSHDYPYKSNRVAPMTIFPIDPKHSAAMLTGSLQVTFQLDVDMLSEALRDRGAQVDDLIIGAPEGPLPSSILRWRQGKSTGVVRPNALEAVGIELMPIPTWVESLVASSFPPGDDRRWGTHPCLADEGEVWA